MIYVAANSPRAWALATTAISFEFNRNHHAMLARTAITPDGATNTKHLLADGWSVSNREDLLEAAAHRDPRVLNQLEVTQQNHRELGTKGILAWDLVRYIALCRCPGFVEYESLDYGLEGSNTTAD